MRISRSSFRYRSVAADDSALRLRIREITEPRVHYGYRRVHVMLRREGWRDNHKRIYRLYSQQGLSKPGAYTITRDVPILRWVG
ncbi:transposase [Dickeya oryzae]|uniref:Transposase n=1 Tax=Dickeya oryzae TaxID=1240404 RepID=A0ABS5BHN2_9GAMM|nr:transposase [Dickeya oryzae]